MLSMQIFQQDGLALKNESFDKLNIFFLDMCVQLRHIKEMTGKRIVSYIYQIFQYHYNICNILNNQYIVLCPETYINIKQFTNLEVVVVV